MDDAVKTRAELLDEIGSLRENVLELEERLAEVDGEKCCALTPIRSGLWRISGVGVFRADAQGRCIEVNDQWCRITGLTREEALDGGWLALLDPDDVRGELGNADTAVAETVPGASYRGEYRYRRPDGEVIWVQSDSLAELDASGRPTGMVIGTVLDISARKRAEDALHRTNARLRAQLQELETLYDMAPVGLCLVDRSLRFARVNPLLAAYNGRPAGDHIGARVEEIVPEIADQMIPVYERIIDSGEPLSNVEVAGTLRSDPTDERTWMASHHPVKSDSGSVEGIISVVQDITSLKRVESELRVAKERLSEAQRIAGVGSWEWDLIEDRMWWSDELRRMLGDPPPELETSFNSLVEFIHPDDRASVRKQLDRTFANDEPYSVSFRVTREDGSLALIHASALLERDEDGVAQRLIGTAHDVTRRWPRQRWRGIAAKNAQA